MEGQKLRELSKKDSFLQSSTVYSAGQLCGVKSRPNDIRQFVRAHKNAQQKVDARANRRTYRRVDDSYRSSALVAVLTKYPHQLSGGQRQRTFDGESYISRPQIDSRRRTGIYDRRFAQTVALKSYEKA